MHTLSSASRTCIASSSAVECTATEETPSSLHARRMRSAISPRFAIRILSNIASFDDHQRLAEFDRLSVFDENLDDGPCARRRNLVHGLHRFDNQKGVAHPHAAAHLDKRPGARFRTEVSGPYHRRGDQTGMLG